MSRHVFHQESLRIAGRRVVGDGRTIEVRDPWTGEVAGTVPKARVEDVREALETARRYRPTLSRADRAAILERAGALGNVDPCEPGWDNIHTYTYTYVRTYVCAYVFARGAAAAGG